MEVLLFIDIYNEENEQKLSALIQNIFKDSSNTYRVEEYYHQIIDVYKMKDNNYVVFFTVVKADDNFESYVVKGNSLEGILNDVLDRRNVRVELRNEKIEDYMSYVNQ